MRNQIEGPATSAGPDAAHAIGQTADRGQAQVLEMAGGALSALPDGVEAAVYLIVGSLLGFVLMRMVWGLLHRATAGERRMLSRKLVQHTRLPACLLAGVIGLSVGIGIAGQAGVAPDWLIEAWPQVGTLLGVLFATWLIIGLIAGVDDMILARYRMDVRDNLKARRMHTQVMLISRTLQLIVGLIGAGIALMSFEVVEQIGTSLLASAGIAGIVVGFAARPVLGNLIAGVQIALTQPIRIDDAVVIEGEWGWIEEITATYVVVKIWDQRRLIVPFSRIIEQPFQNWTRNTADILGSIMLHVDYTCPVDALRQELVRILEGHPKWDGRAQVLQVIETTDRVMVLRVLVSAGDSPTAWELRCDVRERLIAYLQKEHAYALPRGRAVWFRQDDQPVPGVVPGAHAPRVIDDPTLADAPRAGDDDQPRGSS